MPVRRPRISWCPANSRLRFSGRVESGEVERHLLRPMIVMLALAAMAAGQGARTFTGVISDSECSSTDHSHMRMGPTDAECVTACISEHGGAYVLVDGKNVYALSDQKAPEKFAGKKVTVTGTLDAKTRTVHVDSMTAAK